jgi:prepilin-type N-terminal cleavage/methylation domain-containing protein
MISRNNKGFSLIEVIVVIAVLSIIMAAFSDLIVGMQKEVSRMKNKQDRVITNYVIDQALTSPIGIGSSAELLPENEMLKACIKGGATPTCTSNCCTGEVEHEFFLLDPRDSKPEPGLRARLGGTTKYPVYFDRNGGNSCTDSNCFYHVITKFRARCPGGIANCSHAESLTTTVEIVAEPGKESMIKGQTRKLIYFVNLNYQPFAAPIIDQSFQKGGEITLNVYGNAGHPSEVQNFIFEKCNSSNEAIAKLSCYGFMNGVGTIKIAGLAAGTSKIILQLNDGGAENNMSEDLVFNVTVTAPP